MLLQPPSDVSSCWQQFAKSIMPIFQSLPHKHNSALYFTPAHASTSPTSCLHMSCPSGCPPHTLPDILESDLNLPSCSHKSSGLKSPSLPQPPGRDKPTPAHPPTHSPTHTPLQRECSIALPYERRAQPLTKLIPTASASFFGVWSNDKACGGARRQE